jgi:hypothetical protein
MNHPRINTIKQELKSCSTLILSFPRCGRTWMRFVLGHYIEKNYDVTFTKFLERPRDNGAPRISMRHDFMSTTGHIPWNDYFEIQKNKKFIFSKEIKDKKIVYLFRNPLDVLFSYWPYLQSIPYDNFKCKEYKNIVDFANDPEWGLQIIINFMNEMLDHYYQHTGPKLVIKYEEMKESDSTWKELIQFICGNFDESAYQYAKGLTAFSKMQEKNDASKPAELRFYRKGGSNYINELSEEHQQHLKNWDGLKELEDKIFKLNTSVNEN